MQHSKKLNVSHTNQSVKEESPVSAKTGPTEDRDSLKHWMAKHKREKDKQHLICLWKRSIEQMSGC